MQVEWPENRTINIVVHGHSVPAGYFKTPVVDTFNAYPHLLHRALKEQFPHAVLNVIVTAIGGENSISGSARFEDDVLTHKPELLLIDYGLNDRGLGLKRTEHNLSSMIEKAKSQGVKVILLTPTWDTRTDMDIPDTPLNEQATLIRELAVKHEVALADSHRAIVDYVRNGGDLDDLMSQVNHPSRKGHDLVLKELLEWFPRPLTTVE
jgi:acyl-CoA thioesterase I